MSRIQTKISQHVKKWESQLTWKKKKDSNAEITQISELSNKALKQLLKKCSNKESGSTLDINGKQKVSAKKIK